MGKVVNKAELEQVLGVSHQTLTEWQEQGLPLKRKGARGEENQYDTAEVIAWYTEREVRKVRTLSPRDEGIALDNRLKALTLAEKERVLVPVAEIEPLWEGWVRTAAAFMAGRHSRFAAMLEAAPGLEAKRELLKASDTEFLTKLGVEGERMQNEVDALLAKLAAEEASAFLRRVAGDDNK